MAELLRANIVAHLAYYRRSRLLLAFIILFLLMTGLSSLPALFTDSGVQNLNTLQETFRVLNFFVLLFAAGLGLLIISSHLQSRSLKMVFTKPCPPALWLASAFLTAVLVLLFVNGLVFSGAAVLSLFWKLPVHAGLLFVSLDTFAASVGLIAYLMLLGTVIHPALAVVLAVIFNPDFFYGGLLWARASIRSGGSSWSLLLLERLFHLFYMVLPIIRPFSEKTEGIYSSLRVMNGEWKYLLYSLGYALVLSAFCYFVALFALQRKKHI